MVPIDLARLQVELARRLMRKRDLAEELGTRPATISGIFRTGLVTPALLAGIDAALRRRPPLLPAAEKLLVPWPVASSSGDVPPGSGKGSVAHSRPQPALSSENP